MGSSLQLVNSPATLTVFAVALVYWNVWSISPSLTRVVVTRRGPK